MNYSIEIDKSSYHPNVYLTIVLFFMAVLLNQSNILFGINVSLADAFCMLLLIFFLIKNQLTIPYIPLLYFFLTSIFVILTAIFFVPAKFNTNLEPINIASDYVKLIAVFIYFLIGYNLSKIKLIKKTLKWYSVFGLFIGVVGIIYTLLNIQTFSSTFFYAGTRFRGLMIDPNYYSVLQVTSLVFITRTETIKNRYKLLAIAIVVISVLLSGSKTGTLTCASYLFFRGLEYLFTKEKKWFLTVLYFFLGGILILLILTTISYIKENINVLSSSIPSFSRVLFLITNFTEAISSNGSGREDAWKTAIQIIQFSPILGIGVGTYSAIAEEMFNMDSVAHNTFLQLAAEWGAPLSFVFFIYVITALGKTTFLTGYKSETILILRDLIFIMLIGSLAISLNNSRSLWLFLGALIASIKQK